MALCAIPTQAQGCLMSGCSGHVSYIFVHILQTRDLLKLMGSLALACVSGSDVSNSKGSRQKSSLGLATSCASGACTSLFLKSHLSLHIGEDPAIKLNFITEFHFLPGPSGVRNPLLHAVRIGVTS